MAHIVVLAEKREQAEKIAEGLGLSNYRGNYGGNQITVEYASGHLLALAKPEKVNPGISWTSVPSLLPLPERVPLEVKDARALERFNRIKSAIANQPDEVWVATDPDREGEAIGMNILRALKYKGRIKRMWLTESLEPADIKAAAKGLHNSNDHIGLWRAQEARAMADYCYILVTMAYTNVARQGVFGSHVAQGKGLASVASVGRVQSAVLGLVVERDEAIRNFKPITHYIPHIEFDGKVMTAYKPKLAPKEEAPYFTDVKKVNAFIGAVKTAGKGRVVQCDTKKKNRNPPLPFSMTALQRAMSKQHKISAAKTLEIADKLRLAGYLTYPRTEHGELPLSMYSEEGVGVILKMLGGLPFVAKQSAEAYKLHFGGGNGSTPSCFTKAPMEHHGIIPTTKKPPLGTFSSNELHVYEACAKQLVQALYPAAVLQERVIEIEVATQGLMGEPSSMFRAASTRLVVPGWQAAFDTKEEGDDSAMLPEMTKGMEAMVTGSETKESTTKPPKHYTEDSLLGDMLHAGKHAATDEDRQILNAVNGIGTPATRDKIIETLTGRYYIVINKKTMIIESTQSGVELYKALPKKLTSVEMTAKWETRLRDIEKVNDDTKASAMRDSFIKDAVVFATELINTVVPFEKPRFGGLGGTGDVRAAIKLAELHGITVPVDIENPETLERFLGELRKLPSPPTPKMLELAERIASEKGLTLRDERLSFDECRAFLDKHASKSGGGGSGKPAGGSNGGKPTAKMIATAESVANRKGITPPRGYKSKFDVCKEFLNTHLGGKA